MVKLARLFVIPDDSVPGPLSLALHRPFHVGNHNTSIGAAPLHHRQVYAPFPGQSPGRRHHLYPWTRVYLRLRSSCFNSFDGPLHVRDNDTPVRPAALN